MRKKKWLLPLLALLLAAVLAGVVCAQTVGDFNGDGHCTVLDALCVLRAVLNGDPLPEMDVTGDGEVGLADVLRVLKQVVQPSAEPTVMVESVTAKPGDTDVEVKINLANNPGILGATLKVNYDASVLTLIAAEKGGAFAGLTYQKPGRFKDGCNFVWYGKAVDEDNIADGTVLTLTFAVASDAESGTYPVKVSYTPGDVVNGNYEPVTLSVQNGGVQVTKAAETTEPTPPPPPPEEPTNDPTVTVSSAEATAGEDVTVTVSVRNNPGVLGATLKLHYDAAALTLKSAVKGEAFGALAYQNPGRFKDGCNFVWYGDALEVEDIVDGTVLTLTFATSTAGTFPVEITYVDGDVVGTDYQAIDFALQSGTIIIN